MPRLRVASVCGGFQAGPRGYLGRRLPVAILPAGVPLLTSVAGIVGASRFLVRSDAGTLGESVDEEVEEQLEALVGVVRGEVVGEVHEVREAVGRE